MLASEAACHEDYIIASLDIDRAFLKGFTYAASIQNRWFSIRIGRHSLLHTVTIYLWWHQRLLNIILHNQAFPHTENYFTDLEWDWVNWNVLDYQIYRWQFYHQFSFSTELCITVNFMYLVDQFKGLEDRKNECSMDIPIYTFCSLKRPKICFL